jgi:hypothetical protein
MYNQGAGQGYLLPCSCPTLLPHQLQSQMVESMSYLLRAGGFFRCVDFELAGRLVGLARLVRARELPVVAAARKAFTSACVRCRQAPTLRRPNFRGPILLRMRRQAGCPNAAATRRICRLRPSCIITLSQVPSFPWQAPRSMRRRSTRQGAAGTPSSNTLPRRHLIRVGSEGWPSTRTSYSFSWP